MLRVPVRRSRPVAVPAVVALALVAIAAGPPAPRSEPQSTWGGAGAAAPLPAEEAFFAKARERLSSNERRQGRYRYTERSTELNFNLFGRMGSGARQTFQVFPSPIRRMTYRRLIERDGLAIPPEQVAQQDREYLARLDDYRRTLAREGASERDARRKREAERAARERSQVDEAVRIFTFRIERRETLDGHPAIVVSFTPKPGMRPQSREARVAYAFAGTAWVHEHEHELMKLEAEAKDDVSFGWGMIARLNAGMKVLVTRMRLDDGTWVPERSRFAGEGRALLLRKVTIDDLREYSEYAPWEPEQIRAVLAR